jgi:ADP-heptose:LPS heptosyltransferase
MKAMKGVVAVDTATAHLAGALGVKCILLLPEKEYVDWRWKNGCWYDSICALSRNEWKEIPDLIRKM